MKKDDLRLLSKSELITLLIEQDKRINELSVGKSDENNGLFSRSPMLRAEAERRARKHALFRTARSIVSVVVVIAAVTVLVATLWAPVMRVYGTSMEPVLRNGELLLALKNENLIGRGDIIAFYYNDKVLLKRAIALEGDEVFMDDEGNVFVNGDMLDEPYASGKGSGECDVKFPIEIEENSVFVLGDHRSVSVDSRSQDIGNIESERILGKIIFRIWPLKAIGPIT